MTRKSDIYTWEMTTEGWDMTKKRKTTMGKFAMVTKVIIITSSRAQILHTARLLLIWRDRSVCFGFVFVFFKVFKINSKTTRFLRYCPLTRFY